jgi:glutaredoxin 2
MKELPDSYVYNRNIKEYPTEIGAPKFSPDNIPLFKREKTSKIKKYYSSKFEEMTKEYENLINEIKLNERLYCANHNFEPVAGEVYHLYKKESGEEFLSLISPNQWEKFEFIGSYKFLSDGRWISIKTD